MPGATGKILSILTPGEKKKWGFLLLPDILISIADIVFLAFLVLIIRYYTESGGGGSVGGGGVSGSMGAGAGSPGAAAVPAGGDYLSFFRRMNGFPPALLMLVFFLLFTIKNTCGFLVYRAQCRFLCRVATRISHNKLVSYLEGDYRGFTTTDSSIHIREISYYPLEFCQHVLGSIQQIITQAVLIGLAIAGMVIFNGKLFFLLLLILLPPVFAVFYFLKGRLRSIRDQARTGSEKSLQHLREALAGFVESNIYNKNKVFLDRYDLYQQQFNKSVSDQLIVQGVPARMMEIFALLGIVILVMLSRWSGAGNNEAFLTIGVFMAAAYKVIPGIVKVLTLSGQANAYSFTIDVLAGGPVRRDEREMRNAGQAGDKSFSGKKDGEDKAGIRSIRFRGVGFLYNGKPVLDDLHWEMKRGDFIGIAGPSGKGKTTILNLLLGFLTPDKGEIVINGETTDAAMRQRYWHKISYVKQQPFLLHDTILHNITLNGVSCDLEKLQQAIGKAGLAPLVDSFPERCDRIITENGKNISGGQRQRLAIARALYKDADLIILDEPFNELDEGSEQSLLRHFKEMSEMGKLVILITHNRKSLDFCSKILSLDEK